MMEQQRQEQSKQTGGGGSHLGAKLKREANSVKQGWQSERGAVSRQVRGHGQASGGSVHE